MTKKNKFFKAFDQLLTHKDKSLNRKSSQFDSRYSSRYKQLYQSQSFKSKKLVGRKELIITIISFTLGAVMPFQMATMRNDESLSSSIKKYINEIFYGPTEFQLQTISVDDNLRLTTMNNLILAAVEAGIKVNIESDDKKIVLIFDNIDIENENHLGFMILLPNIPRDSGKLKVIIN